MIKELLSRDVATYPILAMVIFLFVFFVAVFWAFRSGSKEIHNRLSRLALDEKGKDQ